MKKISILLITFIYSTSLFSQIQMNENGHVGIGIQASTTSQLSLRDDSCNYGLYITGKSKNNDIRLYSYVNELTTLETKYGVNLVSMLKNNYSSYGMKISTMGTTNKKHIGIKALGGTASEFSCGLIGGLGGSNITNGAGILGSANSNTTFLSSDNGVYAGYFRGDVRVTGTLYADLLTPSTSSASSDIEEPSVQVVSRNSDAAGESVSDKISKVQLLKITNNAKQDKKSNIRENKNVSTVEKKAKTEEVLLYGEETNPEALDALDNAGAEEEEVPQTPKASVRYGLDTDQLKEVFPELVYENANGTVSINYIEMIPLLVQSVNELKEEVESLKKEKAELMAEECTANKAREQITSVSGKTNDVDILSLSQNEPNPFSDKTTIRVNVPVGISTAALFIYDMSGKQIRKILITERGASSVSIISADLNEGMYLYSLIADGKIVNTKKMILTK